MSNGHKYVVEEQVTLAENKHDFKTYKVERCRNCKILRVQFENKNNEWEIFNAINKPPCKGKPD